MHAKRTAYFVSDRTGITAEMLGHSLLTQFDGVPFQEVTVPFIDTPEKARELVAQINDRGARQGVRPLVISTLVDTEVSHILAGADACYLDCFQTFIQPLETELGLSSSHTVGRTHSAHDVLNYHERIEAINFAMGHDDGVSTRELGDADLILVGVSRCGKTPTCLYLALQYGIRAANYPLVPEDFAAMRLPASLTKLKSKLHGLTIQAERLMQVRNERRPGSGYANLANCQFEVREAEALMRQEGIPYLDTTHKSIEELATTILHSAQLQRRIY